MSTLDPKGARKTLGIEYGAAKERAEEEDRRHTQLRKRPPEVDVFEVQSSEDEHKHTKRSPGFPSASGSTRDLTTSRSASPQKKPPGQYRLISPSPEADDEEDIEQFSSPPEAGPSKAQKVSASRELSQFKVASSGERRPKTKQAMKKKDGSVPEPAPIARRGSEEYHEPLPADRRKVKGKAPADEPKQTKLEFSSPFTARRSTRATRLQERVNDPSDSDEPLETEPPPRAKTPRPDRNEVLFGWPLEGRSDVQVTKGDKYRLDEGDFLNDNFLDFGLRFTLHDDSAIPPEVRDKVHMFNSFFYDKLSKKDKGSKPVDGEWPAYDSVKKWTKMANIFDKDYVIVPINESLHWFLAVIFNPRGILKKRDPPLESEPAEVPRRRATRRSVIRPGDSDTTGQQSPSKSPDHQPLSPPKHVDSEDPLDVIDDQSYEDHGEIEKVSSQVDKMTISRKGTPDNPSPQPIKSFTLESFYAQDRPASTKADTEQAGSPAPKGPAKKPRREDCDLLAGDKTYILLLDSLGGTHKAVGNNLKRWLQFEARDKLPQSEVPDVEDMSDSVYLDAKVIEQPNSSDCGVFLIHYVRCLLSDPRSVLQFIGKGPPHRNEEDPAYTAELDAVWRSVAPKGPQKKRRKQSEAARADSGMTVDQAINIDSDSGGEH
ncbi:hypothetical protein Q8F55_005774 [Vanrija albida]|uniref:Ubiquitin-like protease family profile domain-containing protein n=1 Tax=Vanrija albida TaxID=181172 RepID=A0ABR3Q2I5_9TREE